MSKPIAYAVYPCDQWHKENPGRVHEIPYLWHSRRHAEESADDIGGKIVELVRGDALQREIDDLRMFLCGVAGQLIKRAQ